MRLGKRRHVQYSRVSDQVIIEHLVTDTPEQFWDWTRELAVDECPGCGELHMWEVHRDGKAAS